MSQSQGPRRGKRIGGNWVETTDPNSGKTYYANVVTKETSWERPSPEKIAAEENGETEAPKPAKQPAVEADTSTAAASSGSGKTKERPDIWLERQDPNTGMTYYYNPFRKMTSWHRPTDNTVSTGVLQDEDAGKGAWVERVDPKSKRVYYYNPILQKTSWTNPDKEVEEKNPRLSTSLAQGVATTVNRLSQRLSQTFGGGGISTGPNRSSARFSLSTPAVPTNKTSARASLRFGAATTKLLNEDGSETTTFQPITDDRFAKLRAMKNRDVLLGKKDMTSEDEPSSLVIDIPALVEELDWLFETQPFSKYAQEFFNVKKGGKGVDVTALTSWSKTALKQPLHPISDKNLKTDAVTASKAILHFMGDKKTNKGQEYWARIMLEQGNGSPEDFRNELFSQLIKQTTGNPNPESIAAGWKLIAICCGVFYPTSEFIPYLKTHIKNTLDNTKNETTKKFAEYSMLRLEKAKDLGDRLEIPSNIEVQAILKREPLSIRIHLINRTAIEVQVDTWSNVKDINAAVARQLGIKDGTPFTTFEVDDQEQERVLENDDRILDVLAYWERETQLRKKKKHFPSFQFMYKMRLFFDIQEDDVAAIEMAYYQAVNDVTDSRYPCSETDAIKLAALEAQEKFGDYIEGEDVFGENLALYIQNKYYDESTKDQLKRLIYNEYKELKGYTSLEAKLNYLDYVKAWKIYGSAYFMVRPQNTRQTQFPPEVVIAVNNKGVLIVDPETKDFLGEYPYSEIVTWGHSSTTFVLVVGNLIRSRKIFFGTDQGLELNSLIHAYVDKLLEVK